MGKIVKFCSSCDEGFAEKFGFCPNCGATLQMFEMNPVEAAVEAAAPEPVAAEPPPPEFIAAPVAAEIEPVAVEEVSAVEEAPVIEAAASEPEAVEEAEELTVEAASAPTVEIAAPVFVQTTPVDVDRKPASPGAADNVQPDDDGFYVTVIQEENSTRNVLLVGACGLMIFVLMSALVINIWGKDYAIGSIDDDLFNAVLVDIEPMTVEEEQQKKDKEAGGGGGGGRQEEETTQGDLANQTKNPQRPPEALDRHNFELQPPPASTEGNKTFEQKFNRFGDPNGRFTNWNNGTGSGGGQGSGTGTGQGSGRGTGAGSGDGSGYGSGIGNGNGGGTGTGDEGGGPPPPRPKVTQNLAITSKPRPGYTDSARQANVQGTVILRVTFLGSGQIGSISAVKGLPNGLTEQAIAAARRISFQPKTVDGVPQSVIKQIEYTFSIY